MVRDRDGLSETGLNPGDLRMAYDRVNLLGNYREPLALQNPITVIGRDGT
jgi:hypothetical protein